MATLKVKAHQAALALPQATSPPISLICFRVAAMRRMPVGLASILPTTKAADSAVRWLRLLPSIRDQDIAGACSSPAARRCASATCLERGLMNLARIVCASDSSNLSQSVLAFAEALAKWQDADLHILHLTDRDEEPRIQAPLIPSTRSARVLVRDDDPARAIVAHAAHVDADLIVVGASHAIRSTSRRRYGHRCWPRHRWAERGRPLN